MWPQLTNIENKISETIKSRSNTKVASKLNPWVRIISGAVVSGVQGLVISSNNDFKLFKSADQNFGTIYGSESESGAIGYDLANKNAVGASGAGRGYRPSPIIKSLESKEGKDQISRELELTIECFSKDQMELLQAFLMEPGYNLCVEWGFNTTEALSQMINTEQALEGILSDIAKRCLNQDNIHSARVGSAGNYDIFLGFIVGGNVVSSGENFILTIKCKGAPGLPTFLQTHKKTQELDSEGKVIEQPTVQPFNVSELSKEGNTAEIVKERRFKALFNSLPAEKQIEEIKNMLTTNEYSLWDFIGFDEVVSEKLTSFESAGQWDFLNVLGKKAIKVGNSTLKKENLFPEYRYISMGLCAKLLNRNGGLTSYKIKGQEIKIMIDIDKSIIGGFPNMFSTKPTKLIIPGSQLPPFRKYFLATTDVTQQAGGKLSDEQPINYALGHSKEIQFPESEALDKFGFKEDANYWGYLKNIYVNFDVFYSKITQTNKTIREIFLDILNEISSGVNSFWNFQIVESKVTKDKPVNGLKEGDIVITVIDENWIGKNANTELPTKFVHAGIYSAFTSADLDISIPQDMTNQIVCKRLALATNPESTIVNTGELFNSELDLFMDKVTIQSGGDGGGSNNNENKTEPTEVEKLAKEVEDYQKTYDNLTNEINGITKQLRDYNVYKRASQEQKNEILAQGTKIVPITNDEAAHKQEDLIKLRTQAFLKKYESNQKLKKAQRKEEQDAEAAEQAKLSSNFEKICILPNPLYHTVTIDSDNIKNPAIFDVSGYMRIYTLDDGNYFDRLRNDAFPSPDNSSSSTNKRLSHPLPIKYNFTTIGVSGLRRGDMFNILGIPSKYEKHGLFQITQVEHTLTGMEWKTSVTGEYRQFNS